MSFSTFLEIQYVDDPLDIEGIAPALAAMLDEDGIHLDVLGDLRTAFAGFAGSEAMFNLSADYLAHLVERIASLQPTVAFHARGRGEALRDVWVREFENGKAVFSVGSFL